MASSIVLPIVFAILGVIITPVVILIAVLINKNIKKIDVEPNAPIIDMTTRRQFTEGFTIGIVKEQIPRKNGTIYFEVYPLDWVQGWNKPRPKVQKFVVGKDFVVAMARGERSSRRERIDIAPRSKLDLPDKMRETDMGKDLTVKGQLAHLVRTIGAEFVGAGDQAINQLLKIHGSRGEMSADSVAQLKQENAKYRELFKLEKPSSGEENKK